MSEPKSPSSPPPLDDRLAFSVPEAMRVSGLGRNSLYKLINSGELKSRTILRRRIILKVDPWSAKPWQVRQHGPSGRSVSRGRFATAEAAWAFAKKKGRRSNYPVGLLLATLPYGLAVAIDEHAGDYDFEHALRSIDAHLGCSGIPMSRVATWAELVWLCRELFGVSTTAPDLRGIVRELHQAIGRLSKGERRELRARNAPRLTAWARDRAVGT